jgi:nucleoside-diphosphate-sugar epimerase
MDKLNTQKFLQKKILITGGSGWLGKAAVNTLVMNLGFKADEIILVSRIPRVTKIGEHTINSTSWSEISKVPNIGLEYFLPFAFVTREQMSSHNLDSYAQINNSLIRTHSEIIKSLHPANVINISSGAAKDLSKSFQGDQDNIYGKLKFIEEESMKEASSFAGSNLVTARLWNCSGFGISKVNTFAMGEFVSSVLNNRNIVINSKSAVLRRYVDISEFLLLCMRVAKNEKYQYFESGGELIELRKLAEKVVALLNPKSTVEAPEISESLPSDDYFSKSEGYEELLWANFGRVPMILDDQILETANYIRANFRGDNLNE